MGEVCADVCLRVCPHSLVVLRPAVCMKGFASSSQHWRLSRLERSSGKVHTNGVLAAVVVVVVVVVMVAVMP